MSLIRSRRHKPYDAEGPSLFEHRWHDLPYDARYDAERCVNFRRRGAKPGGAARSAKQTRPIRVRVVEHVALRIIATRPPLSKGIRKWIHARTSGTALRPSTGRQREIVVPCCGRFVEVSWKVHPRLVPCWLRVHRVRNLRFHLPPRQCRRRSALGIPSVRLWPACPGSLLEFEAPRRASFVGRADAFVPERGSGS